MCIRDSVYRDGANILILSDRGVDENHVAIPSLLAVSALQQHLVKTKKRTSLAMILESGEPREVHHFATLLGYGACAINPYLAQETIKQLIESNMLDKDYYAAVDDYNNAVLHGIVKIASKMGISTIQSYQEMCIRDRFYAAKICCCYLYQQLFWYHNEAANCSGFAAFLCYKVRFI